MDLLSRSLTAEYGRGFSRCNLFHMIRQADTVEEGTVQTLSAQLSWFHFIEILYLKDPLQSQFHAELARQELEALQDEDRMTPDLVFRDPYLLDFFGLADTYSERDLEAAILKELERFLLDWTRTSPLSPSRSA